jgi:dTDP-4-dehydrorhamnose 3,5-epimerase-like enzyme
MQNHIIKNLPKIEDPRGNLTFIEEQRHIPFKIKRVYWIYDVPSGEKRGGHAFKEQEEFIIALSGSFDVLVDNGERKKKVHLNRSHYGLYIPAGQWRSMINFSTNSLSLVLASTEFDEHDYIRDYDEFCRLRYIKQPKRIEPVEFLDLYHNTKGKINSVDDCIILDLEINHRIKGNMTVIENRKLIPFDVKRVYYLYDVPGGMDRGGHAHKDLSQLIVAAGGSFDVVLDDGKRKKTFTLNRPYKGLLIVPGIWRELVNFSSGSNCLVLASENYSEKDYIREYVEFTRYKKL